VYASLKGPIDYEIWGVMQQCMYETKICDVDDLQKLLTQTLFDFERYQIAILAPSHNFVGLYLRS